METATGCAGLLELPQHGCFERRQYETLTDFEHGCRQDNLRKLQFPESDQQAGITVMRKRAAGSQRIW
tara:strand:+ start:856 stop:1059 length:204 start_codon:yes stop_codon:yes gene_type:complete